MELGFCSWAVFGNVKKNKKKTKRKKGAKGKAKKK